MESKVTSEVYPKRLIEVDLPIKRISAHARREKSIRHGHISTLHIWWARRPLAACRAVICASLWPDPADPLCPPQFVEKARGLMLAWARDNSGLLGEESYKRFIGIARNPERLDDNIELRGALLDFIADFANWDNSTVKEYLDTSRALTQSAHEALGGEPGTRPLVVDPFAGGGAIPLEALRVGADAFASDLNPVAVVLNKVVLEYIPKYGQRLADEVRKWGQWVKEEAEKELAEFYPKDQDGATPVAYLWARTVRCEGPGCGTDIPLVRSCWLAKRSVGSVALQFVPNSERHQVNVEIIDHALLKDVSSGTTKKGAAICPVCGFTTPVASVRQQIKKRRGGTRDAMLLAVVTTRPGQQGRSFRLPNEKDLQTVRLATQELARQKESQEGVLSIVPDESTEHYHTFVNRGPIYGMSTWEDYFTARQALALATLSRLVREVAEKTKHSADPELANAIVTICALGVTRLVDISNALCIWKSSMSQAIHVFTRQALPMVWDFAETSFLSDAAGDYSTTITNMLRILEREADHYLPGQVVRASATRHPLPDDSADAVITDPPYYYSVQYADLSDFFYVWLRRILESIEPEIFNSSLTPKQEEIIVQSPGHQFAQDGKNNAFYEEHMKLAMLESRRILRPSGVGLVVFAHTSTAGWEAQLQAMLTAGWTMTGSWAIDTELPNRVIAQGRSVLASSIHLVCRPRENPDGSLRNNEIGDWREVLSELPERIHEWMPRLAEEGVVGADAIFACLGPALEIFSRYAKVEKASGDQVTLREYLEQVWAAVSKEALNMIFKGADATGFEEDARLTAMWLWTLSTGTGDEGPGASEDDEGEGEDEEEGSSRSAGSTSGYILEYDAARKIAQGLGAHLEKLGKMIEVKGDKAWLLGVAERKKHLFDEEADAAAVGAGGRRRRDIQTSFLEESKEEGREGGAAWGEMTLFRPGETTLDKVHQAMLLFAAGRSEGLKRFLVDDGIGNDGRFWRLAQALSALYPTGSSEKRWIDGVLARKKGLGF
jgi:putative DNA methylase